MLQLNTGLHRRELLQIGSLSALGVNLLDTMTEPAQAAKPRREMNCIFLWLLGGPSHIDMFDMKPEAPAEIRGELNPISTRVPGMEICELMPHLAGCTDKFSMIRSMHSYSSTHGQGDFHLMSGNRLTPAINPPGFGAMLTWQQERRPRQTPPFVQLGTLESPRYGAPGFGGYLGRTYDPFLVDPDPNSASF